MARVDEQDQVRWRVFRREDGRGAPDPYEGQMEAG
jgi:hypothetical protein